MRSPLTGLSRWGRARSEALAGRAAGLGRARHVLSVVVAAGALSALLSERVDPGGDRAGALAQVLTKRGLSAAPEDMQWIERPSGVLGGAARAIARASSAKGEPADLYLVETTLSPEGVLLSVGDTFNLTETSGADEARPVLRGERLAYVARPLLAEVATTVHVMDLSGHRAASTAAFTRLERAQNAITNYQQTGQIRGVAKRTFAVEPDEKSEKKADPLADPRAQKAAPPPPRDVSVELDARLALTIRAGGRVAEIPLEGPPPAMLPAWIRADPAEIARPGNLANWAVDRVRAIPWIGDDTMQTVKAVAFTALDFVLRNKESVTGDTGAEAIAKDLGKNELDPPIRAMPVDPEIGWPPAPLEPWIVPALPGEGQWNPQDKDSFVRRNEGLPAAFLTTYIRSDRSRKATRVYIALWDPRQVELHMMAGTVEPKGATGEAGPGLIPRTPEVMKRVVAASNAGFQALHGEFGMMADGVVYLPPKPYAASVAVLRDGSTAFGTWPGDTSIPEQILSYRQNMTVMVQDEKFNPYNRTWWGGTPPGWADKTHTVRTGICMTKERFVAYFYGSDISPDALAQAMIQARCAFGIALDMNAGHSGLEFYKVAPAAELEPLGRPLQGDWEGEGDVPGLDGWKFRARRLIRGMGLMHFPRYIKREGRDYFYMTLRHVLPGPSLGKLLGLSAAAAKEPAKAEGEWRLKGLPQHGFPYALALAEVRPDAARPDLNVRVLKIDPRTVTASQGPAKAGAKTVAVVDAGDPAAAPKGDAPSLWHSAAAFSIASSPPVPDAVRLATGEAGNAGAAVAALGVNDEDGMLIYAELAKVPEPATAADAKALDALVKKLGCSSRILLARPLAIALGGDTDLAGGAVRAPSGAGAVRLLRTEAPGAKRIFEDTPIVPFSTWYPLQQQRIRYFKKPQGGGDTPAGGDESN